MKNEDEMYHTDGITIHICWAAQKNLWSACYDLTCGLKVGVAGGGHVDPKLLAGAGHPSHVLLRDPGDPVHAGDEALHAGHEADAGVLAIEAQQEPVTLAMS